MRRLNARSPEIDRLPSMDSSKPQIRAISSHRLSFSNPKSGRGNIWIFVAAVVVILAVFFYLSAVTRGSGKKGYGIVIDAGSTGTRIHVFEFSMRRGLPVLKFGDGGSATMKVNPGLSDFVADPGGAGRSILELLKFGKGRVPKEFWEETEVRLMATAGLRRLGVEIQERILDSCRRVLRSSGFTFRDDWASVITGSDEGIYAWVAANYALGTLGGDPQQTTGIVELGGASAQVTFVSSEPLPPEYSHTLKFGEFSYKLYSHSLLHFGQNVAYESLRELLISGDMKFAAESVLEGTFIDPCTPRGYSHDMESLSLPGDSSARSERLPSMNARGNFSECRSAALKLLQKGKDECLYQDCHIGSTFVPELQGKFLATENFFYTSKFFGLAPTALLSDLTLAGQQFCEEDWVKLKKIYHTLNDEDLMRVPGIYENWELARAQVEGYSGCRHQSFKSYAAAVTKWTKFTATQHIVGSSTNPVTPYRASNFRTKGLTRRVESESASLHRLPTRPVDDVGMHLLEELKSKDNGADIEGRIMHAILKVIIGVVLIYTVISWFVFSL